MLTRLNVRIAFDSTTLPEFVENSLGFDVNGEWYPGTSDWAYRLIGVRPEILDKYEHFPVENNFVKEYMKLVPSKKFDGLCDLEISGNVNIQYIRTELERIVSPDKKYDDSPFSFKENDIEALIETQFDSKELEKDFNWNIAVLQATQQWSVDKFGNNSWTFEYSKGEYIETVSGFDGKMVEFRGIAKNQEGNEFPADLVFVLQKDFNIVSIALFLLDENMKSTKEVQSLIVKGHFPLIKSRYFCEN